MAQKVTDQSDHHSALSRGPVVRCSRHDADCFSGYLLFTVFYIIGSGLGILSVNAENIALGITDV